QVFPPRGDLGAEGVIEMAARPPVEEADAELPGRLGAAVEFPGVDAESAVQVVREGEGGRFADADHAHVLGPDDADPQVGQLDLERDGGEEAGAATAQYEDVLDHGTRPRKQVRGALLLARRRPKLNRPGHPSISSGPRNPRR